MPAERSVMHRHYRLFDTTVTSELPLRLLHPANPGKHPVRPPVTLRWTDEPALLDGQVCFGVPGRFHGRRTATAIWAVWPNLGWAAKINPTGRSVAMHPLPSKSADREDPPNDHLVTNVLNRLPALWGMVPLHSAVLDSPHGLVLITGRSGSGKSTLSQQLAHGHGWVVLDDDACAFSPTDLRPVPMRARVRLRPDAAQRLQLAGDQLAGYRAGKVCPHDQVPASEVEGPARVVVHLARVPESGLQLRQLPPSRAIASLADAAAGLDRHDPRWQRARFELATRMGVLPSLQVAFGPDTRPSRVANAIADSVMTQLRTP